MKVNKFEFTIDDAAKLENSREGIENLVSLIKEFITESKDDSSYLASNQKDEEHGTVLYVNSPGDGHEASRYYRITKCTTGSKTIGAVNNWESLTYCVETVLSHSESFLTLTLKKNYGTKGNSTQTVKSIDVSCLIDTEKIKSFNGEFVNRLYERLERHYKGLAKK